MTAELTFEKLQGGGTKAGGLPQMRRLDTSRGVELLTSKFAIQLGMYVCCSVLQCVAVPCSRYIAI